MIEIGNEVYSKDIWGYLEDMPYMPSRADRDKLVQSGDWKRVQIWDYFFRVKPNDVGRPQQNELAELRKSLEDEIASYTSKVKDANDNIKSLRRSLNQKRLISFLRGFISTLVGTSILLYAFTKSNISTTLGWLLASPFLLYGLIMLLGIGFVGRDEKQGMKDLKNQLRKLRSLNKDNVRKAIKRINELELEIKWLVKQISASPSDKDVREWLTADFEELWKKSKDSTGLGTRLAPIRLDNPDGSSTQAINPIPVLGPGELQNPDHIPQSFTTNISPDLNKHLTARHAFYIAEYERYEVLYGIYYIEYILIADDMLATYGFFYDFITSQLYSEQITEQYYKDVVAIEMTKEFRVINLGVDSQEIIYVENAPTFTMSLASGDHRTVTFVSEKYFMEIKEKINITQENISKIYWIRDSEKVADQAIKALRYYLRLHKGKEET